MSSERNESLTAFINQCGLHSPALARDRLNRPARRRYRSDIVPALAIPRLRPIASALATIAGLMMAAALAGAVAFSVGIASGVNAPAMLW